MEQPMDKPAKGARAAMIRKLHFKYPELGPADLAKRVGCTPQNVTGVMKSFLANHSQEELSEFQHNKADVYDALQHRILESVTSEKLDKMAPYAAVIAAATLEDKARLVRGQATSFNVNVLMDVADMIRADEDDNPASIDYITVPKQP
jgi:hypothetical protein